MTYEESRRLIDASGEVWDVLSTGADVLYFCELHYGAIRDVEGIKSQFLRALFLESMATLGLLDVAYVHPHSLWPDLSDGWGIDDLRFCGRYDGLLYVRLNPLGAYALGFTEKYETPIEGGAKLFRLLPNLELVWSGQQVNAADRAMLELVAAPKGDRVWELEAGRMLAHIAEGGSFQSLKNYLENHAAEGLPETVVVFLDSVESKLGACRGVRRATVVEWTDEFLARLVATSAGTKKLCRHVGENLVVVDDADLGAFRTAARKLGYVVPETPAAKAAPRSRKG